MRPFLFLRTRSRDVIAIAGAEPGSTAEFSAARAGFDVTGMAVWQRGSLRIHFNSA